MIAHNGEINTVQGNRNWMRAREGALLSDLFGDGGLERAFPIMTPGRVRHRQLRRGAWSCCTSAAARCRTPS